MSKVQNLRKESGFEVMDNINIYVAENPMLEEIVKKYEDIIKHDTLTKNIFYNEQDVNYTEVQINSEKLRIFVEVIK